MDSELIKPTNTLATIDEWKAFTNAWLDNRHLSDDTRAAYRRDITKWFNYCTTANVDPLAATFIHINTFRTTLEASGLAASSIARNLHALSSWYGVLIKIGATTHNPVTGADVPSVSRDQSTTVGVSLDELDRIVAAASGSARDTAILLLLGELGMRVSEVCDLTLDSYKTEKGRKVITFTAKGGKPRKRPLTTDMVTAIDQHLAERAKRGVSSRMLLCSVSGRRLDRHRVLHLVQKYAALAGLDNAADLSPHSLRHGFATTARELGVSLEDVQDAMGHVDPRTTRRYDRDRHNLDRDPSAVIARARLLRRGGLPDTG